MAQTKRKTLIAVFSVLFAVTFSLAIFAGVRSERQTANAYSSIAYMAWDMGSQTVKEVEGGCAEYTVVTDSTTTLADGVWYVVSDTVTISDSITVSGTVNLILCDGASLTVQSGIRVSSGNTLNVYAQSTGENMGAIVATGTGNTAGIGGGYGGTGGNVNIHGGVITATGDEGAAGIGGGDAGNGGNVNIYGGIITATGDEHAGGGYGGAGIGGGEYCNGGNVNIYGGTVTATGGDGAAGIGRGDGGSSNGALTVAEGYVVYGGTSADPTTVIEKSNNDYARSRYMIVTVPHHNFAYSANGATSGSVPTDATEYESDDTVTVLGNTGNLVNGSFTFVGWNTEANGTGISYGAGDTFTITEDITLYAQWRSVKVIVTDGDSAFVLNDGVTYNVGDSYSFTRDGDSKTEEISKVYNNCGNALTGAMTNYGDYDNEAPWHEDYTAQYGGIRHIVIGSGITHVGNYAFQDCGMLKDVTFSEGLVSIGVGAFRRSNAAWEKALCLPNSLTTIGNNAFEYSQMKIIKFGTGLTTIGSNAFNHCQQLVVGGQSVSLDIEDYYYDYPYEVVDENSIVLTLPSSVTNIGSEAFRECTGLKKVIIPNSVNNMGSNVFGECENISSVTWSTGLTTIPSSTFESCSSLTTFTIPAWVTEIGSYAFEESGLTSITIPAAVEYVGSSAFADCGNLATVVFASADTTLDNYGVFNGVGSSDDCRTLTLPADWDQSNLPSVNSGAWYGGYFTLSPKFASSVVTAPTAAENTVYTGNAVTLVVAGSAAGGTMQYKVGNGAYSADLPTATNAGTYTVYYKVVGDRNHNDVAESSIEVTITPIDVTVTVTGQTSTVSYDGQEHTVSGYDVSFGNVPYTANDFTFSGLATASQTNAGTAYMGLSASQFANINNNFATVTFNVTDGYVTVNKINATVTVTGHNTAVDYDSLEHTVSGYDVVFSTDLYTASDFTFSGNAEVARTNAGTTDMGLSASQFANINNNFDVVTFNVTDGYVTVNKINATVTVTGHNTAVDYDSLEHTVSGYDVVFSTDLYTASDFTFSGNAEVARINAGTTDMGLSASQFANISDNFDVVTFNVTDGYLTVEPIDVTVTPDNKAITYGDNDVILTYTVDGLVGSDVLTGITVTRVAGIDVGTYVITATHDDEADGNYIVTIADTATYTIGKKALAIKANDKAIIYGGEPANDDVSFDGFVNNDTRDDLGGTLAFTYDYEQFDNVGTYTIAPSGFTSGNYEITYGNGILTVAPKAITVTVEAKTSVYGTETDVLTATAEGVVNGDADIYELFCDVTAMSDAGSYDILGIALDGNYAITFIGEENAYTVKKKALAVIANDKTITYGDEVSNADVKFDGFVGNDTRDVLGGTLAFTYDYEQFDDIGTYTIAPSGLTSNNYEITYENGILTVVAKEIKVVADAKSKTYGEVDPALTYEVEGLVNGDKLSGALVREKGETIGTYAIKQGTLAAGDNYEIIYTGAEFDIHNATIIVTADDKVIVEGAEPVFTVSYEGFAAGDTADDLGGELVFTCDYRVGSAIGIYTVTPCGLVSGNYDIIFVEGTLTVKPLVIEKKDIQVIIETEDGEEKTGFDLDISLEVEVKTSVKAEEQESARDELPLAAELSEKSLVVAIYNVRLVRTITENGVERVEEIQPEDIKPGTKIKIAMHVPETVGRKSFAIMHIHSETDVEYVDYVREGDMVYITVDRLSDFAFIVEDTRVQVGGWKIEPVALISISFILLLCLIISILIFNLYMKWEKRRRR